MRLYFKELSITIQGKLDFIMIQEKKNMIENIIIFSKELKKKLLTQTFGVLNPEDESFSDSLVKINEIAINLEKGIFNQRLDSGFASIIFAIKRLSIALVFKRELEEREINEWEKVAKEIISGFEKIYEPEKAVDDDIYNDFKNKIKEIINWHLKEESPIDKMKDALW